MWKIVEIYDLCGNLEIDSISLCKRFVCQYMKIIRENLLWLPLLFFIIATQHHYFFFSGNSFALNISHSLSDSLSLSTLTRCLPGGHAPVSLDIYVYIRLYEYVHINVY